MAGDHAKAIIKMADKHLAFVFNVPPPVEPAGQHLPVLRGARRPVTDRTYIGITFLYSLRHLFSVRESRLFSRA
jgi:hypothetical protein